ncbi:hypothetical protein G6F50_013145 [Rhizopus delemar]|uniref:Uncharacterized protein n=1 Tax=Rhizopus delemar TaxID=936053 RepID=A0A9P7CG97_9FUNG|nr:hypothetical protein G6F50_013145 [Rhizopus delemar]
MAGQRVRIAGRTLGAPADGGCRCDGAAWPGQTDGAADCRVAACGARCGGGVAGARRYVARTCRGPGGRRGCLQLGAYGSAGVGCVAAQCAPAVAAAGDRRAGVARAWTRTDAVRARR